jgi:hypothetical protein
MKPAATVGCPKAPLTELAAGGGAGIGVDAVAVAADADVDIGRARPVVRVRADGSLANRVGDAFLRGIADLAGAADSPSAKSHAGGDPEEAAFFASRAALRAQGCLAQEPVRGTADLVAEGWKGVAAHVHDLGVVARAGAAGAIGAALLVGATAAFAGIAVGH